MVLGNDGLLGDILLRVDSPTTLVHAALVSKRWFHCASYPFFLRRFSEIHPQPRLLGAYVTGDGLLRPEFVSVPSTQPTDLVGIAHRANLGFGANLTPYASTIWDVRDGRVLYESAEAFHLPRTAAMRAPLLYPGRDLTMLPLPPPVMPGCPHVVLLIPDAGDGAVCYRIDVGVWDHVVFSKVHILRVDGEGEGEWSLHCSVVEQIDTQPVRFLEMMVLAGGKVYMVAAVGYVLGLDLTTARFFVVELPDGVMCEFDGSNVLVCRGRDDHDTLCLVHVEGDTLNVWIHKINGQVSEWVLKDTMSMQETCANFLPKEEESAPEQQADNDMPHGEVGLEEPEDNDAPEEEVGSESEEVDRPPDEVVPPEEPAEGGGANTYYVVGAGDNAEFVFLELGTSGVIVYVHLGTKKVEKVYQRDPDDDNIIRVYPFMMVRPLTFPMLPGGEAEEEEEYAS
ncbi:hypothetical protein PR202_ga07275 [Eleusine coracana subsp. coracana]|uniref:F-box protein AT5G49610-like beta-propeller domain-containing protein n=1 Tax=Eleusine coracana subsp. coracana TaxID=191504 RepID=A0AAV5BZK1_ELECO|nr:hypothetical protein QOZ80_2AG0110220 [Eleusine coracana subsp. coracana]GJM90948.1 hypothetical protein PR202_ga07275 [Eleusine coracana subsp. coracana]